MPEQWQRGGALAAMQSKVLRSRRRVCGVEDWEFASALFRMGLLQRGRRPLQGETLAGAGCQEDPLRAGRERGLGTIPHLCLSTVQVPVSKVVEAHPLRGLVGTGMGRLNCKAPIPLCSMCHCSESRVDAQEQHLCKA